MQKEIRDEWMDNIDWVKVHRQTHPEKRPLDDSSDDDEPAPINKTELYQQMIELMKPKETVSKALRRLGGGKAGIIASSASQRLKAKKNKTEVDPQKAEEEKQNKENVVKLTGLADKICQAGNLEIYQETYEKLSFLVKNAEEQLAKSKTVIPEGIDDDDALDMFADDFDKKDAGKSGDGEKTDEKNGQEPPAQVPSSSSSGPGK